MTIYSAPYASKTAWTLKLVVTEESYDAVANTSVVLWRLRLYRGDSSTPWNNSGSGYSVTGPGGMSGTFPAYDFEGIHSGTDYSGISVGGFVPIADATTTVAHNANGTGSVTVSASHAAAATLGTATIGSNTFTLTTLTRTPAVPSSVALAYTSDTQASLSWADTSASNGKPTTNQIQTSVNGAAFSDVASIAAATSLVISVDVNQKVLAQVRATNSAGSSAYSAPSGAVYTTPAAPSSVAAMKTGSDIVVGWANNVGFAEYQTVVWHGTMVGSTITWDGAALATAAAGATSYTHVAPSASLVHVYRVQSKNLDTGALASAFVESNSVQLLAPPNAPTFGTVPSFADKAAALVVPWTHNPVDTTGQTAYEFGYSTNGGSSWSTSGKVTSGTSAYTIAASTYAGNVAVTLRVRTWGAATSAGSDGTGASPWSTTKTVTFKTLPVATIVAPADSSTLAQATVTVVLGFAQAESASFVQATIGLYQGATLLEQVASSTLGGTTLATRVADGVTYTVKATVTDSNSLVSAQAVSTFDVNYTEPVPATVTVTYLEDSGIAQLDLTIPSPGAGEAAAVAVTITRTIGGSVETVVDTYPASASLTFLDVTPTINGTNLYTVTTFSADGASVDVTTELVTAEPYWAFLNGGDDFTTIVNFMGNLKFASAPARAMTLVDTAGRSRPLALFGTSGSLEISGSADLGEDMGSTPQEVEQFILTAKTVCYRDPSGRRMFGTLTGSLDTPNSTMSGFAYKVTETS